MLVQKPCTTVTTPSTTPTAHAAHHRRTGRDGTGRVDGSHPAAACSISARVAPGTVSVNGGRTQPRSSIRVDRQGRVPEISAARVRAVTSQRRNTAPVAIAATGVSRPNSVTRTSDQPRATPESARSRLRRSST